MVCRLTPHEVPSATRASQQLSTSMLPTSMLPTAAPLEHTMYPASKVARVHPCQQSVHDVIPSNGTAAAQLWFQTAAGLPNQIGLRALQAMLAPDSGAPTQSAVSLFQQQQQQFLVSTQSQGAGGTAPQPPLLAAVEQMQQRSASAVPMPPQLPAWQQHGLSLQGLMNLMLDPNVLVQLQQQHQSSLAARMAAAASPPSAFSPAGTGPFSGHASIPADWVPHTSHRQQ
jgi:hypothetical protein